MDALGELARHHHLTVIEDACHALGAQTPDGTVGDCRHSDMTVFSTHAVKAIATGEGGVVTTNSPRCMNACACSVRTASPATRNA